MYKYLFVLFITGLVSIATYGQQKQLMHCGTITTDEEIVLLKNNIRLSESFNMRSMETIFVPIQFHLVGTNEGNGRLSPQRVFESLCKLNEDFANTNLQFYFNGEFKYLDNTAMYDMSFPPIPPGVSTQFALKRVDGAVNVFVGNGLSSGNSGFYTSSSDVIYMDKRYMNDNDVILSHELGHFFGLPHTFLGWEETTYDPESPTPTEVFRGSRSYNVEYVDRTINCEESGDFFCGTPADYILDWNGGCDYTGGAVDPDSVLIDPDETNIMSYYSFSGCQQFIFAEDQSAAMVANYNNRVELQSGNIMPLGTVSLPSDLLSPIEDEDIAVDNVVLEWSKPENTTHFLVELGRLPNFVALDVLTITDQTSMEVADLKVDKKYYWRVSAFNNTETCELLKSERGSFNVVEMLSDINEVSSSDVVTISPNPSLSERSMNILSDRNLGESNVSIFNIQGQRMVNLNLNIRLGENAVSDLNINAGTYFVKISNAQYSQTIKLVRI